MNKIIIIFLLICSPFFSWACNEELARDQLLNFQWQTEDYPPYNYRDSSGKLVGIFTEVLSLAYQELNIPLNTDKIDILPWARLVYNMENYPEYAGFSMVTTAEREKTFQLLPLPFIVKSSIMVLKNKHAELKGKALNDLSIAVVRGDIGQALLNAQNIKSKQVETTSAFSMLKMLAHNRIDAVAYAEDVAYFQFSKLAIIKDTIVPIHQLDDGAYSNFIFHKDTPKCGINLLKSAINKLDDKGKLQEVKEKYLQL